MTRSTRRLETRARNGRLLAASCGVLAVFLGCRAQPASQSGHASGECVTCHLAEYRATDRPPHPGVRPTTCGACHQSTAWHPYRLLHSWPLEGAHAKANCFGCHVGEPRKFEGTDKACLACHQKDDDRANSTVAHHASFPKTCETCHTASAWKPPLPHQWPPPEADAASSAGSNPEKTETAPVTSGKKPVIVRPKPRILTRPDTVTGASKPWHK